MNNEKIKQNDDNLIQTITYLINDKSIVIYILVAYGFTWVLLTPLIWFYDALPYVITEPWHVMGAIGPTIGAIVVLNRYGTKEQIKNLWRSCIKFAGIGLLIYALLPLITTAIVFPIELLLGTFSVEKLITENSLNTTEGIIFFPIASLSYGIFEEFGWRGFLFPRLQSRYSALKATIIVSLIWWLWHLPMFFYRFNLFFALLMMYPLLLSGTVIFNYLYNKSRGSLLLVFIIHVSYDLVAGHSTGISVMVLSAIWIFMTIYHIKSGGSETLGAESKVILKLESIDT
jgi:membrane protease YdiL (CAAX protease family)